MAKAAATADSAVIERDQAAMAEARAAVEAAAGIAQPVDEIPDIGALTDDEIAEGAPAEPITTDVDPKSGQVRFTGPGTEQELRFSTTSGGPPPNEAQLKIASSTEGWETDMEQGHELLILAHLRVDGVSFKAKKIFDATIVSYVEFDANNMEPRAALMAVHDLKSRAQYDRAVIDQAADAAADILENGAPESGVDLAAEIRERMYDRFKINDDAHAATVGTADHEDPDLEAAFDDEDDDEQSVTQAAIAEQDAAAGVQARIARLEEQIEAAHDAGEAEREDALRDELAQVQIETDPDLGEFDAE